METRDLYIWLAVVILVAAAGLWRGLFVWRRRRFLAAAGRKQKAALLLLEEQGYRYFAGPRDIRSRMNVDGSVQEKVFSVDLVVRRGVRCYPVKAHYRRQDSLKTVDRVNECRLLAYVFAAGGLLFVNLADKKIQKVFWQRSPVRRIGKALLVAVMLLVAYVLGTTV